MTGTLEAQGRGELGNGVRSPPSSKQMSAAFETFSRTSAITSASKAAPGSNSNSRRLKGAGFGSTGGIED